ncbi:MAG: S-layer homology domain-containing protein [Kastovskya adunca ATA6-11-RM4]|jgi:hypothetical protein|nr:S-layer homology domain-containing protein [Kastovskya adunca ATA6-11-RM4]
MPTIVRGGFYRVSNDLRSWRSILVGSILSSAIVAIAASVLNPVAAAEPHSGNRMGASLLQSILGGEAVTPNQPASNSTQPTAPTAAQLAQAGRFPDTQGNWAQSFIEGLAARDIIRGFPDGTFRPNAPVTRAQFAAMIRQAFPREPLRSGTAFVDVPANHWGNEAIQYAYRTGFIEGYPNNVFNPEQNIPRAQVLVALASGLNLAAANNPEQVLSSYFQDAAQVPAFAQNAIASAALNQLVVNYPNVGFLNPNQTATRADVAAFIYQALVNEGRIPQLGATNVATRYIVGYEPIATPPQTPDVATLRQQYRLPGPPITEVERLRRIIGGGASIGTPTAFGADGGDFFVGATYQSRARFTNEDDGAIVAGFGLGDARQLAGLETAVSIYDLIGDTFDDGGVSFKLHRTLPGNFAVAVGVENAIVWGNPDGGKSVYGVVSKVIPLKDDPTAPLSRITASVGLGGGRFRSLDQIASEDRGTDSPNVFGSVGVQVVEPVSLIAEWTGQDLNLGASIVPIRGTPLVITPAIADVTNNAGDGTRFIIGVGYAF